MSELAIDSVYGDSIAGADLAKKAINHSPKLIESLLRGHVGSTLGALGDVRDLQETVKSYLPKSLRNFQNAAQIFASPAQTVVMKSQPKTEDILGAIRRITPDYEGSKRDELIGSIAVPLGMSAVSLAKPKNIGKYLNDERNLATANGAPVSDVLPAQARQEFAPSYIRSVSSSDGERGLGVRGSSGRNDALSDQELKELIADPNRNPAILTAKTINPEFNLDAVRAMPPSSLQKQFPIAKAYDVLVDDYGIDPKLKQQIFIDYLRKSPDVVRQSGATNYDELTEAAYKQLQAENTRQFDALIDSGVNVTMHNGDKNYINSMAMLRDALLNKNLDTFAGGDRHKFLNAIDDRYGINDNEKFRAVHDYFGHGTTGATFGQRGEEIAYGAHSQMFSPLAKIAAASETRGQNSFVNYSGINANLQKQMDNLRLDRQFASPAERAQIDEELRQLGSQWQYAKQDGIILPPAMLDLNYAGQMDDYLQPFIKPKNPQELTGFHWSNLDNLEQTDPAKYGSGIRGKEADRLRGVEDKNRTYFYTAPDKKEAGLGANQYTAALRNVYDLKNDPDHLASLANRANNYQGAVDYDSAANDIERLIKQSGYEGYVNPDAQVAVSFTPQNVSKKSDLIDVYHGTSPKSAESIEKNGFDLNQSADGSWWFTTDPNIGEVAATGNGAVVKRTIDPNQLKLATQEDADKYFIDQLISQGYDGARFPMDKYEHIQIFNPEKLKN